VTTEQLVNSADYIELSRLVLEHGWRTDNGQAGTIHELYADKGDLILPPTDLLCRRGNTRVASATRPGPAMAQHSAYVQRRSHNKNKGDDYEH
jgi:hypothetical protein